jgi:hypothetical protein
MTTWQEIELNFGWIFPLINGILCLIILVQLWKMRRR